MTMAIEWAGPVASSQERNEGTPRQMEVDAALIRLIERPDDRLLRDAGLTREEILGPERAFWREWSRSREPWTL